MKHRFFITGTDTGVGKTFCTAALLRAFQAQGISSIAMKPVAAGLIEHSGEWINDDVLLLRQHASVQAPLALLNPYAFKDAIAPHIAAQREGILIDGQVIVDAAQQLGLLTDVLLVEGVGGFHVPLGPDYDSAKMAADIGFPVILIVGMRLGCLNHALLTAQAIQAQGLTLAGWIANVIDADMQVLKENIAALEARLHAPKLATIPYSPNRDITSVTKYLSIDQITYKGGQAYVI